MRAFMRHNWGRCLCISLLFSFVVLGVVCTGKRTLKRYMYGRSNGWMIHLSKALHQRSAWCHFLLDSIWFQLRYVYTHTYTLNIICHYYQRKKQSSNVSICGKWSAIRYCWLFFDEMHIMKRNGFLAAGRNRETGSGWCVSFSPNIIIVQINCENGIFCSYNHCANVIFSFKRLFDCVHRRG